MYKRLKERAKERWRIKSWMVVGKKAVPHKIYLVQSWILCRKYNGEVFLLDWLLQYKYQDPP